MSLVDLALPDRWRCSRNTFRPGEGRQTLQSRLVQVGRGTHGRTIAYAVTGRRPSDRERQVLLRSGVIYRNVLSVPAITIYAGGALWVVSVGDHCCSREPDVQSIASRRCVAHNRQHTVRNRLRLSTYTSLHVQQVPAVLCRSIPRVARLLLDTQ